MKTCKQCEIKKELDKFYVDSRRKDKRRARCKDCENSARRTSTKRSKVPNAETLKAFQETDKGIGLKEYKSIDKFFADLGFDDMGI